MTIAPRTLGILPRPHFQEGLGSWIATVDHKKIGILYLWSGLFFFFVAGFEALLIRVQLAQPQQWVMDPNTYNALFTMHATTMIFMAIMPTFAAFMNYFLPIMIGARDVAYPRLNAFSYWNYLFGAIFMNSSWFLGDIPDQGWYAYAPLTSVNFTQHQGVDFWTIGLLLLGIGSLVSSFNFIVTILNMRAPGMTLMRMPVFVWTTLIISVLVAFAFPAFTVALLMLLFDRTFAAQFFSAANPGSALVWQHLFWTFGHPEVYILILPAFGVISEVLPVFARKPLFGYAVVVLSSALIGFLGFTVWAHHMFTVGMGPVVNTIFALTTMAISIPTGVKIFNWLSTLWGGRIRFTTAMLFATSLIAVFTIGGLSGFMHAIAPSDMQQNDTYFIVAHIHYVLFGGSITAIFAAVYYWFPKMFARTLNERMGKTHFWLHMIGFNTFAFPLHILGLTGMPRRTWTYTADMGWNTWNFVSTVGVFILTAGLLIFIWNVIITMRRRPDAPADPWDGRTLEWSIPSPPPEYNFRTTPRVTSLDDWWYKKYPPKGQKPPKPKLKPEADEPHGIHMPGQSYMPFILAIGTTVLGYGLLFDNWAIFGLGMAVTVISIYGWVFEGEGGYTILPEGEH